jgi:hypothetical protein
MNQRPHAAHAGHSLDSASASSSDPTLPSQMLHPDSDHVRALLEELDDVIYLAIGGDADSLQQAYQLWPKVLEEIGWELVEESREQYLRYSTDLARRFEHAELRDPERALSAIEIIELLMRD